MRRLALLLAVVCFAAPAFARARYNGICAQSGAVQFGSVGPSTSTALGTFPLSTVTVYQSDGVTLAAIYSDNAGTPKSNPFTDGSDASLFFYADNGTYNIQCSGTGITAPFTFTNVPLIDPAGLAAAVPFPVTLLGSNAGGALIDATNSNVISSGTWSFAQTNGNCNAGNIGSLATAVSTCKSVEIPRATTVTASNVALNNGQTIHCADPNSSIISIPDSAIGFVGVGGTSVTTLYTAISNCSIVLGNGSTFMNAVGLDHPIVTFNVFSSSNGANTSQKLISAKGGYLVSVYYGLFLFNKILSLKGTYLMDFSDAANQWITLGNAYKNNVVTAVANVDGGTCLGGAGCPNGVGGGSTINTFWSILNDYENTTGIGLQCGAGGIANATTYDMTSFFDRYESNSGGAWNLGPQCLGARIGFNWYTGATGTDNGYHTNHLDPRSFGGGITSSFVEKHTQNTIYIPQAGGETDITLASGFASASTYVPGATYVLSVNGMSVYVQPTVPDTNAYLLTVGGICGAEPVWPSFGATVNTGACTFKNVGQIAVTTFVVGATYKNITSTYVVPTVANAHVYQLTTAGTCGAEPAWPVDGSSIATGACAFLDAGFQKQNEALQFADGSTGKLIASLMKTGTAAVADGVGLRDCSTTGNTCDAIILLGATNFGTNTDVVINSKGTGGIWLNAKNSGVGSRIWWGNGSAVRTGVLNSDGSVSITCAADATNCLTLTGVFTAPRIATFPDNTGTVAELNVAQSFTANQAFTGVNATSYATFGLTKDYFVTTDFTTANNTSLQAITGLAWTFPVTTAINIPFTCSLIYSQATAAVSDSFGVQDVTVAPTNAQIQGVMYTSATASSQGAVTGLASTTATAVVTGTPSATATKYVVRLNGFIEHPSNASTSVFQVMVSTAAGADVITVYRGSYCQLN